MELKRKVKRKIGEYMSKVNIIWASMFGTAEDVANDVYESTKDNLGFFNGNVGLLSPKSWRKKMKNHYFPVRTLLRRSSWKT